MPEIKFPVVSICNINPMVTESGNSYLRDYYNRKYGVDLKTYSDFYHAVKTGQIKDENSWLIYQTHEPTFNRSFLQKFGYDAASMFSNCKFSNTPCDPTQFEWFYHPRYGNCFR